MYVSIRKIRSDLQEGGRLRKRRKTDEKYALGMEVGMEITEFLFS